MIQLPKDIWNHIYSFDSTYYNKYNQVLSEFNNVNDFWGLKFHNPNIWQEMSSKKMRTTYERASSLSDYWNNDFLKIIIYQKKHIIYGILKQVCSPIHISDEQKWGKYWTILMNNIGCYKFLEKRLVKIYLLPT